MMDTALAMSQDDDDEFARFDHLFENKPKSPKTSFQKPWAPRSAAEKMAMKALLSSLGLSLSKDIDRTMRARAEGARSVGFTLYDPAFRLFERVADEYNLSVSGLSRAIVLAWLRERHQAGELPGVDDTAFFEEISLDAIH